MRSETALRAAADIRRARRVASLTSLRQLELGERPFDRDDLRTELSDRFLGASSREIPQFVCTQFRRHSRHSCLQFASGRSDCLIFARSVRKSELSNRMSFALTVDNGGIGSRVNRGCACRHTEGFAQDNGVGPPANPPPKRPTDSGREWLLGRDRLSRHRSGYTSTGT